jgi:formylmethanofuran dehydrogenase subunit B
MEPATRETLAGATARIVEHATCLGCGCACDDIDVVVAGERIVEARRACPLGVAWFGDGRLPSQCLMRGSDASLEKALDEVAELLGRASAPLIYLAPDLSCEAQREGIALADALHAALDSVTSESTLSSLLAAQERGRAAATLGEIRNRADVVLFWGVDPAARYPRYWSRYAPEPAGLYLPDGRRSRVVVAVDVGAARGPADADLRVAVSPDDEVATLIALRAIVTTTARVGGARPDSAPWARARTLAPALLDARYAAIVHDGESSAGDDPDRADALIALAQALNGPTRCALSTLRAGGNRSGADAVATSQTGYPMAIDFARGHPRYRPYDGAAGARLQAGEADALLVIGATSLIPARLTTQFARVPRALIGPRASESALATGAAVVIDSGVAGIHEGGTALRMDDVSLPLRPSLAGGGPRETRPVVREVRERVQARRMRDAGASRGASP